jgi:hypothetical protein
VEKPSQEVGVWIILKWILEIEWSGMYWIDLAQDKDKWRALANTVINLSVSKNSGKFLNSFRTGGF